MYPLRGYHSQFNLDGSLSHFHRDLFLLTLCVLEFCFLFNEMLISFLSEDYFIFTFLVNNSYCFV